MQNINQIFLGDLPFKKFWNHLEDSAWYLLNFKVSFYNNKRTFKLILCRIMHYLASPTGLHCHINSWAFSPTPASIHTLFKKRFIMQKKGIIAFKSPKTPFYILIALQNHKLENSES